MYFPLASLVPKEFMAGWEELIDELPATPDREGTAQGRIYSLHRIMPITFQYLYPSLGLVNGAKGMGARIVPGPNGRLSIYNQLG